MVESLQMFLFLFKSKYRRKFSWFSPFLCSVLIVLLFCHNVLARCSEHNCVNGVCSNETCVCIEGWQGPECQYCGGKVKLTEPSGIITDGPGNYSVSTACSWLISPLPLGPNPPPIRIRLESFATECGWDHLYVYDGDSVRSEKLLAVYSGVIEKGESDWTRQVVARSGSALLHFFSDDAYAMEGFNVTYSAYSCPSDDHRTNCSNHGECEDGWCKCEPYWTGVACDEPVCPNNCNTPSGTCTPSGCECTAPLSGPDCSVAGGAATFTWAWREWGGAWPEGGGAWPEGGAPPSVAGHVLLRRETDLLSVGGEMFGEGNGVLYRFDIEENRWEEIITEGEQPAPRFAHSAILYENEVVMYGGVVASGDPERGGGLAGLEGRAGEVTNEVWRLDLSHAVPQWRNVTPTGCSTHRQAPLKHCGGLHISGHTAVMAHINTNVGKKPIMLVFFGHSPQYGYLHLVQEFYLEEGIWSAPSVTGWAAHGGFAHSALYNMLTGNVYVHAGLVSHSEAAQGPSSALYEYDVQKRIFRPLPSSPLPRYLHTAVFVSPGVMLVFGGNSHNDSAAAAVASSGAKCYSANAMLYNIRCKTWHPIDSPVGSARAAPASSIYPGKKHAAIIYGGFDGRLRSDALLFAPGDACSRSVTSHACLDTSERARACVWLSERAECVALEDLGWKESFETGQACLEEPALDPRLCAGVESCGACTAAGCVWCGACGAGAGACGRHTHLLVTSIDKCGAVESPREACGRYHSCVACHSHHHHRMHGSEELSQRACYWAYDENVKCKPANSTDDIRSLSAAAPCSAPCSTYNSCTNCTAEECIWCPSAHRCVDKNAYAASFPLGGCRAWATLGGCASAARGGCAQYASCAACRAEPACGWCDDGGGGGRGACLPGGEKRPHSPHVCAHNRWHFTHCPLCQCNGHALCDSQGRCVQPCGARALGPHCQLCAPGHWGEPLNGAQCTPCDCNSQAVSCAPDTGRCYCSTKGLAGDRCDKCDNTNHYHADVYNKGACYYDLAVDYQFTFNLSKKEDRHLSAINFRNAPVKADVDADFTITCSAYARMNLTVRTRAQPTERTLFSHVNCTNFRYKFAKAEHSFGVENNVTLTTFFVYVYDFRPPLWIQISFSQYPKLNLQQFFITFSSCFLLLLLVAAALWKIKQKYDLYRRRQRLFVEMEQMASRPFSQVSVEIEKAVAGEIAAGGPPAPVALEPCRGGRAAVLSLLVRLPTGGSGRAPPLGGLAVASALVTLGLQAHKHDVRAENK